MRDKFKYTVVESDSGEKIKNIIKKQYGFSSRLLTKLKFGNCVYLNGQPAKMHMQPVTGDIIEISLPEERSEFIPENIPIDIIYEDNDLIIINKQPGHVVHPTKGHPSNTIANGIMKYMIDTHQSFKIRFINRLDMDTTGLLIVSKNSHCQDHLSKQMKENKVKKIYVALVKGFLENDKGKIDAPIGRLYEDHVLRGVVSDGFPSVTNYKVLQRYCDNYTLVELQLETGRTHQIRVHMNHIGHPVLSDALYDEVMPDIIKRQALHASYLSFIHPITGEPVSFYAPVPEDIKQAIEKINKHITVL